ncbi:YqiA/YcfP family alpha/beta fold hydrolase [Methylibium petroleiphilum]|uniref:YqiA/YcfP family alpha/beta fold hydrolase n=1 Tax=Methylibium petroleiphilum TaxID=105560 RepID=UPI001ACF2EE5|nr:YqiA/YcfP family alpha/beta fold hydrolase [Methylibium petroleiphilum]MBN9204560.1 esterase [Methylibium petroleiphilum]
MKPPSHLLYLHGFRSSPGSAKAQRVAAEVARLQDAGHSLVWCCPQLPPSPAAAKALIDSLTHDWPSDRMAVIGSSLGGFYATVLAEQRGCRAVVLNPAVDPADTLAGQIGEQTAWHDPALRFEFTAAHVEELRAMRPQLLRDPARYLAVIAKGDEVLDWRDMTARYAGARIKLLEGGDHALSDFDDHLPDLLGFLGLG